MSDHELQKLKEENQELKSEIEKWIDLALRQQEFASKQFDMIYKLISMIYGEDV